MGQPSIELHKCRHEQASRPAAWALNIRLASGWLCGALVIVLSAWILQSFLQALLAACVTAVASWPLYRRFVACLPSRIGRSAISLIFTCLMVVFVLAPLLFAFAALLTEAHSLLLDIAAADQRGMGLPRWLENAPVVGPWVVARWQSELAQPGTLMLWLQRTDPALLLGLAQSLGQFTARHAFIIAFTVLLLFFLYREGESLAAGCRRVLRQRLGEGVKRYLDVGTRAVRASVNSMLIVGLFDGLATAVAYAMIGVPQATVWGGITGSLALVPFLGYVAVIALTLQLAMKGAASLALISCGLGVAILLCGDKVVRPFFARDGVRMPFVWILMGCLGGFEVLGLVGLVVGPVVLTLARELWQQRVRDAAATDATNGVSLADRQPLRRSSD